jgi:hypothetical protein
MEQIFLESRKKGQARAVAVVMNNNPGNLHYS